jgi:hypothetical protein
VTNYEQVRGEANNLRLNLANAQTQAAQAEGQEAFSGYALTQQRRLASLASARQMQLVVIISDVAPTQRD